MLGFCCLLLFFFKKHWTVLSFFACGGASFRRNSINVGKSITEDTTDAKEESLRLTAAARPVFRAVVRSP